MQLCEIKISYNPRFKYSDLKTITTSFEGYNYIRPIFLEEMNYLEHFAIILLNRRNCILGYREISKGGTSATIVDAKVIFQTALKCNAHGIILAHNHPSGNPKPSESDKILTNNLKEAGKFLDIQILDHLILTNETFFSFADEGLI